MNHKTRDVLVGISLVLNVLLAAALLYDYTANDSRWTMGVLWTYLAFTVVFLFMWGLSRREEAVADAKPQIPEGRAPARPAAFQEVAKPVPAPAPAPLAQPIAPPVAKVAPGPFTFNGYTLYSREVQLNNGGKRMIHFFSKRTPASGAPTSKPAGFHVGVNERTGLPFLKRGDAQDGADLTPRIEAAYRPQCSALTDGGHQCRNSARQSSKYCSSHFGYQPPTMAKAAAKREDTLPRVRSAPDTVPSVRARAQ